MISLGIDFNHSRLSGTETVKPVEGNKTRLVTNTVPGKHDRNRTNNTRKQETDKLLTDKTLSEAA